MNSAQTLWWTQARADLALFEHLRGTAKWRHQCHTLQALQMATEKIAKASFRAGTARPSRLTHLGLTKLLRRLSTVQRADQPRLARVFSVGGFRDFQQLLKRVRGIAHSIEQLPPAIAGPNRINTEYPWPDINPSHAPAEWTFGVWDRLDSSDGREFQRFVSRAIAGFDQYADVFRSR